MTARNTDYNFNPRSREGSDHLQPSVFFFRSSISIHAPAKGATRLPMYRQRLRRLLDFNPRSREGSDHWASVHPFFVFLFQSTLPRRERPYYDMRGRVAPKYFNPRSREGSDHLLEITKKLFKMISIHAPAKGATKGSSIKYCYGDEFQSTLPRRERPIAMLWT